MTGPVIIAPDQDDLAGFGRADPTREAIAAAVREREARRGFAPLPEGGLFDDCTRRQQELF
jgi:hypothetical protein